MILLNVHTDLLSTIGFLSITIEFSTLIDLLYTQIFEGLVFHESQA